MKILGTVYFLLNSFVNLELFLKIKVINNEIIFLKEHERHSWTDRKRGGSTPHLMFLCSSGTLFIFYYIKLQYSKIPWTYWCMWTCLNTKYTQRTLLFHLCFLLCHPFPYLSLSFYDANINIPLHNLETNFPKLLWLSK